MISPAGGFTQRRTGTKNDDLTGVAPATGSRVVCLPASAYRDELAGEMLAQLLRNQGFEAENVPARLKHEELIDRTVEVQPECICVSVLPPTSIAQARHLASAIRERLKSVTILIGVWSARFDAEKLRERLRGAHVSDVAVSLADAVQRVYKMTAAITDAMLPAPTPPNEEERLAELNGLNLLDTPSGSRFRSSYGAPNETFQSADGACNSDRQESAVVQISGRIAGRSCRGSVHFARHFPLWSRYR